jgi:DNA-binding transcriptional LysR family regulator
LFNQPDLVKDTETIDSRYRIGGEAAMNLNRLHLFVTVVNCRSLTKASPVLRMNVSSIWRQVALLQKDYKTKFYNRTNNGIELTPAGEMAYEAFKMMLAQEEDLKQRVHDGLQDKAASILKIGGSDAPSISILPPLLVRFQQTHLLAQIVFRTRDSWGVERMVLNGDVEVGLLSSPSRSALLSVELFSEEEMVAFVSVQHPLARKSKLTLEEFARAPLVVRKDEKGMAATEKFLLKLMRDKVKPNIIARCESSSTLKAVVEAGLGVGLIKRSVVALSARDGKVKILSVPDFRMSLPTFVAYRKDHALSPQAQDFLALLRANRPQVKSRPLDVDVRKGDGRLPPPALRVPSRSPSSLSLTL